MSGSAVSKILFMGLGASGKSSIRSIVFEGKSLDDVKDYNATINYTRSTRNIIDSAFQIFDCGGQESFISVFVGDQAEFIFSILTFVFFRQTGQLCHQYVLTRILVRHDIGIPYVVGPPYLNVASPAILNGV